MPWGTTKKNKKKPRTIDLRKKQSFFDTMRKKKNDAKYDDNIKCMICFKKIGDNPLFCTQYLTRTKLCNAGPFCSEKCLEVHIDNTVHY